MDLNDQLVGTALNILNERYVDSYLSIYGIDPAVYAQSRLIAYTALTQENQWDPASYKLSHLYAFKVEAGSILTNEHSSKLALEHNYPI